MRRVLDRGKNANPRAIKPGLHKEPANDCWLAVGDGITKERRLEKTADPSEQVLIGKALLGASREYGLCWKQRKETVADADRNNNQLGFRRRGRSLKIFLLCL